MDATRRRFFSFAAVSALLPWPTSKTKVTFDVAALDAASVHAALEKNGAQLARIVAREFALNPSLRPRF